MAQIGKVGGVVVGLEGKEATFTNVDSRKTKISAGGPSTKPEHVFELEPLGSPSGTTKSVPFSGTKLGVVVQHWESDRDFARKVLREETELMIPNVLSILELLKPGSFEQELETFLEEQRFSNEPRWCAGHFEVFDLKPAETTAV